MQTSGVVTFVSAGLLSPKKRDHALARRQLYLNYGALSLATTLQLADYDAVLVHGEHRAPAEVFADLQASGRFPSRYPLMLSIPSFYALPWAQVFCHLVKAAYPDCRIVVGGRWVVGPDMAWFRTKLPEADVLAPGLGEIYIQKLLTEQPVLNRVAVPTPGFTLNHLLLEGHLRYQPSVEASRGCGMGCNFCEERDIPLEKLRQASAMVNSLALVQEQYGGAEIHPYLQSSMFTPNARWAAAMAEEMRRQGLAIQWRTETRVDAMTPETLASLAAAGLKVIDLGLETASPTQILAMEKSDKPDRYLRKAEDLLAACQANGVKAKVNVLLFAGETEATLNETRDFLDSNASAIAGVSVGPVIAYGPPKTAGSLIEGWAKLGARPVDPQSAVLTGISTMHLSGDFDAPGAEAACLKLSRRYMDADAYFALKGFSYYPRDYTQSNFDDDVRASDPDRLPFGPRSRQMVASK